jgi:hypothetical protein
MRQRKALVQLLAPGVAALREPIDLKISLAAMIPAPRVVFAA